MTSRLKRNSSWNIKSTVGKRSIYNLGYDRTQKEPYHWLIVWPIKNVSRTQKEPYHWLIFWPIRKGAISLADILANKNVSRTQKEISLADSFNANHLWFDFFWLWRIYRQRRQPLVRERSRQWRAQMSQVERQNEDERPSDHSRTEGVKILHQFSFCFRLIKSKLIFDYSWCSM